jgi:hypothetical protein
MISQVRVLNSESSEVKPCEASSGRSLLPPIMTKIQNTYSTQLHNKNDLTFTNLGQHPSVNTADSALDSAKSNQTTSSLSINNHDLNFTTPSNGTAERDSPTTNSPRS